MITAPATKPTAGTAILPLPGDGDGDEDVDDVELVGEATESIEVDPDSGKVATALDVAYYVFCKLSKKHKERRRQSLTMSTYSE
jgi:hypothetical protein